MRTLTQVWVFLLTLTFLFLLIGFQLLGRIGLFFAFLLSLVFLIAALRNSLRLFRGALRPHLFSGNDPTGFLSEIEKNKGKFGFKRVDIYTTHMHTPPLVWKNTADRGHVVINENLIYQLKPEEIKLLAVFLLSHLENRSFVGVHVLSIIKIPFIFISIISRLIAAITNKLLKTKIDIFSADLKFITMAETNKFEAGYFLNKLHNLSINQFGKSSAFGFFSTLSLSRYLGINEFGIPKLNERLQQIMGFSF